MISFPADTENELMELYKKKKIALEGNILKVVDTSNPDFRKYIEELKGKDVEQRRKRLTITKQIQDQNKDLISAKEANESLMSDLQEALAESKKAKAEAEKIRDLAVEDLDTLQKRTQFELIGMIVKIALGVIIGVGILTTVIYGLAIISDKDTQIIGSTWSNMFGILLTNAFSIIGTIMGVKYASSDKKE
jgi:Fe2+ transport system protein B